MTWQALYSGLSRRVRKFKADPDCALGMNGTTGDLFSCPEKLVAAVGCEKTKVRAVQER